MMLNEQVGCGVQKFWIVCRLNLHVFLSCVMYMYNFHASVPCFDLKCCSEELVDIFCLHEVGGAPFENFGFAINMSSMWDHLLPYLE